MKICAGIVPSQRHPCPAFTSKWRFCHRPDESDKTCKYFQLSDMAEVNRFLTYRVIPYSAALNGTSVARENMRLLPKLKTPLSGKFMAADARNRLRPRSSPANTSAWIRFARLEFFTQTSLRNNP